MAPNPYIYTKPLIEIGGTDFVCYAEGVSLTSADVMGDGNTFCTPGLQIPSEDPVWTCTIDWKTSYAADGLWNLLIAIASASPRVASAITIRPNTAAIGVANPQADFNMFVPTPDFIMAKVGKSGAWSSSAQVVGQPVFTTA